MKNKKVRKKQKCKREKKTSVGEDNGGDGGGGETRRRRSLEINHKGLTRRRPAHVWNHRINGIGGWWRWRW